MHFLFEKIGVLCAGRLHVLSAFPFPLPTYQGRYSVSQEIYFHVVHNLCEYIIFFPRSFVIIVPHFRLLEQNVCSCRLPPKALLMSSRQERQGLFHFLEGQA